MVRLRVNLPPMEPPRRLVRTEVMVNSPNSLNNLNMELLPPLPTPMAPPLPNNPTERPLAATAPLPALMERPLPLLEATVRPLQVLPPLTAVLPPPTPLPPLATVPLPLRPTPTCPKAGLLRDTTTPTPTTARCLSSLRPTSLLTCNKPSPKLRAFSVPSILTSTVPSIETSSTMPCVLWACPSMPTLPNASLICLLVERLPSLRPHSASSG